jgi:hypothetical protein
MTDHQDSPLTLDHVEEDAVSAVLVNRYPANS